jgi:RimJ/RimL family protein N-acetyltransferase
MKFILETDRLYLREFNTSDAQSMFDLNSDQDVIRYTGDPPFESVDEAKEFLANYSDYKQNGFGRWAVILKDTNEFIGWCGLKKHDKGFVDIGFRFFQSHWGYGYASESAKATLDYGFQVLKMDEIIGRAAPENFASIRVLEKINMKFWKRSNCDGFENAAYYRIHKSDCAK